MRRFANRQRVGKWQRRHSASGCYWQFLRRPLKFACRFASTVITVASSEGNLKEAAVIETSRIAKVRSVSASLWIAPKESLECDSRCLLASRAETCPHPDRQGDSSLKHPTRARRGRLACHSSRWKIHRTTAVLQVALS